MTNLLAPPIEVVILYIGILAVLTYAGWRLARILGRRLARARIKEEPTRELAALQTRLTRLEDETDYLGDALRVPPPPPKR